MTLLPVHTVFYDISVSRTFILYLASFVDRTQTSRQEWVDTIRLQKMYARFIISCFIIIHFLNVEPSFQ